MRSAASRMARVLGMVVVVAALGLCSATVLPASAAPLSASALYADATSRDEAVRKALDDRPAPAMSRAVKSALASYESLVRHYPTSGYCDDALWRAAQLAIHAAARLKQPELQTYAQRYLAKLQSAYPTSKYTKQAPELRASLSPAAPRPTARDTSPPAVAPPLTSAASPPAAPTAVATTGSVGTPDSQAPARLLAVHRTVLPDVVRVTLDVDREVVFRQERLSGPARIFFDLMNTTSARSLADRTVRFEDDGDAIRQIRIGQQERRTLRVVLDASGVASCHVSPLYSPYRLVIDCVRESSRPVAPRESRPKPLTPGTFARRDSPGPGVTPAPSTRASSPPPVLEAAPTHEPRPIEPPVSAPPATAASSATVGPASEREPSADFSTSGSVAVERDPGSAAALGTPGVDVRPPASPSEPPVAAGKNLDGGFSLARQLGLTVSRVVIDPGHGGHDPGAKGPGVTEATLVLDIALRLETLLRAEGVEVVLTRRTDEFVALEARTAIANATAADLFLSIHANASSVSQAGGVETYYLDFANSASAAAVAARENAASGQSMNALPDIVKTIALNGKQAESRDFATQVQRALVQKLRPANGGLRDLGVKQAPFVVLVGASMPSVLAEVSFLTNAQEARLLKGQGYRQRIAEALFTAVQRYQASLTRASRPTGQ